jgi:prepilin-type N-terminal cleavage/methylation domain-containing protein
MRRRAGFTLLEALVVLLVGSVLLSMVVRGLSTVQDSHAVRSARDSFISLHARARAHSIERGVRTRLRVSSVGDSVLVVAGADTVESFSYPDRIDVQFWSWPTRFDLCMTPRGYADSDCNTFTSWAWMAFNQGDAWSVVLLYPAGHLWY